MDSNVVKTYIKCSITALKKKTVHRATKWFWITLHIRSEMWKIFYLLRMGSHHFGRGTWPLGCILWPLSWQWPDPPWRQASQDHNHQGICKGPSCTQEMEADEWASESHSPEKEQLSSMIVAAQMTFQVQLYGKAGTTFTHTWFCVSIFSTSESAFIATKITWMTKKKHIVDPIYSQMHVSNLHTSICYLHTETTRLLLKYHVESSRLKLDPARSHLSDSRWHKTCRRPPYVGDLEC